MNFHPIPDGWEKCPLAECTQVWVSLSGDKLPAVRSLDHDMSVRINGEWISEQSWTLLGIIPIRKAPPPKPIEFVVEVEELTRPAGFGYLVMKLPQGVKPGMRFREVVK